MNHTKNPAYDEKEVIIMAGSFFTDGSDCMCIYRNTVDYPFASQSLPPPEQSAGLYLQSTRPPAGASERIFSGAPIPLETVIERWGRGVYWNEEAHYIGFSVRGMFCVRWIIPVLSEPNRPVLVELLDENDTVCGKSASRGSILEGEAVVYARHGTKLRLVNSAPYPINITAIGSNGLAVAGTLTVMSTGR